MKRFFRSRADTAEDDELPPSIDDGFDGGVDHVPPPVRPGRRGRSMLEQGDEAWVDDTIDEGLADIDSASSDEGPFGTDGLDEYEPPLDDDGSGLEARLPYTGEFDAYDDLGNGSGNGDGEGSGTGSFLKNRLESPLARARLEAAGEQRSAWGYLGLLTGLFCFLVVFGYACSDARPNDVTATDSAAELAGGASPSRLVFRVDGDVIAVQGAVPDEAARDQLISAAQAVYGPENVVDNITIEQDTTLESGTVRFVGSSTLGDERPEALHESVAATFGLANRGFEVGFAETVRGPVDAEARVDGAGVVLSGELPDEGSVVELQAVAGEVWGPENVDGGGLTVGESVWTDGAVRLTGSTAPNDDRPTIFGELVKARIDALVVIDTSGLSIIDNSAQLAEVQATVDELVAASPIQFAPDSPVISEESDAVLDEVAAALSQLPDVPFEVVGHTDDVGDDEDNLVLSQQRAEAVVARLQGLGIDPVRMTSRGEGEANPVADNTTDEGKAANRRIEFILVGTSSG
jgi:OOP family OmpA-OmpF porin